MKRLLWTILLVCIFISISGVVGLAEFRFSNWGKWDQLLPSTDDENWIWAIDTDSPVLGGQMPLGIFLKKDRVLFASTLYYGDRNKTKASILFYSLNTIQEHEIFISEYKIPQPSWAIAVFPPIKKNCMVVMVYKIEGNKSTFFEKWEIDFENYQLVVPKESEFREMFKIWLYGVLEGATVGALTEDEIVDCLLPKLVLIGRSNFILLIGTVQEIKKIDGIIKIRVK